MSTMQLGGYPLSFGKLRPLILETKNFFSLYCIITWNENHALMVIHYCIESQSYNIAQLTQTPDNSIQITIDV